VSLIENIIQEVKEETTRLSQVLRLFWWTLRRADIRLGDT